MTKVTLLKNNIKDNGEYRNGCYRSPKYYSG